MDVMEEIQEEAEVLQAMEMLSVASSHVDSPSAIDSLTFLDDPAGEFYIPSLTVTDDEEDMDDVDDNSSLC